REEESQGRGGAQAQGGGKRLQKKQKHLYLILDDWAKGFTIRKIDDADSPHLGDPPVLRLVAPVPRRPLSFAALGSHIFATSNGHCGTLVYDTETAGLATGPCLPDALLGGVNVFIPTAADTLYALAYFYHGRQQSFEVMSVATGAAKGRTTTPALDWSWRSVSSCPLPFRTDEEIVSYAVHPDGRTIFVTANTTEEDRTFSFDTKRCEWRCHGGWALPFEGQGYFDNQLEAWVGLHEDGGVCACQVISHHGSAGAMQQPDWKMVKDKLWSPNKKVALEPTLTCMGGARFCIVECVMREGLVEYEDAFGDHDGCMLHITLFGLRYNHMGELQTLGRTTNSCPVSKHFTSFSPVAFWM
ncbi:hypothetical protein BS78_05G177200, partial [Paspalum vaginatum]